ncbi:hypothetical protein MRX96_027073 [Rhipicephalus microplus]
MERGTSISADLGQRGSASDHSTLSLKGSTNSAPDLGKKRSVAYQDTSKGQVDGTSAATSSDAKPAQLPASESKEQVAGGSQSTIMKDMAAPRKDTKQAGMNDVDDDEPAVDPP